ncbi:nuclear transport factor 2 family protein [Mesorhizobium sp. LHD-90]|uniref:nuclear transport factor 2 family protein n=1 Tax=Mesorhizobium sp. LHD-90 TaxID=3071414 RepID=UPI0027E08EE1|nr:nuclear transport factor 2 family protein [Mesorhizobium sp. LHD-90]MDQ6435136.1 nuclear transport factor 2 family protein [Mesorhizobium sp. LHD-90]
MQASPTRWQAVCRGKALLKPRQIAEQWVKRFNAGDPAEVAELYHKDAVQQDVGQEPLTGRPAITAFLARCIEVDYAICIPEVIDECGDVAAIQWRTPSGKGVLTFFTVRDGRIAFQRGWPANYLCSSGATS